MCEPFHSIVQYPDQDDSGPTRSRLDAATSGRTGSKLLSWGKRILDFFHFSRLGSGHSEATGFGYPQLRLLPQPNNYEVAWWDRTVKLDGFRYIGNSFDATRSHEAAEEYANRTSVGSLSMFRRFLEGSLMASDYPSLYVARFLEDVLNHRGRDDLRKRMRDLLGLGPSALGFNRSFRTKEFDGRKKERLTKLVMGYTRKRDLLLPAWADDDKLWTPRPASEGLEG